MDGSATVVCAYARGPSVIAADAGRCFGPLRYRAGGKADSFSRRRLLTFEAASFSFPPPFFAGQDGGLPTAPGGSTIRHRRPQTDCSGPWASFRRLSAALARPERHAPTDACDGVVSGGSNAEPTGFYWRS